MLSMLVDQPAQIVTREEIRRRLWPNGTIVEFEQGINTAVKKLRLALGDSAEKPRYVQTIPRRGYRLIVPIERQESNPAHPLHSDQPFTSEVRAGNLTGRRISHYRVLNIIGGGAMGLVYQAEDLKLGRRVALKFLPEELTKEHLAIERLRREACAASGLNHPNICTVHAIEEESGHPFIAMELLEGCTLRDRIAAGPITIEETLDFSIQIAEALQAAHEQGIIHRDIKPANIFITTRQQIKILDFGVAKLARHAGVAELEEVLVADAGAAGHPTRADLTKTGVTVGTAAYMSPEQVRGEELDGRTDLFSFGLVLYEMVTGRQAFEQATATLLHDAILNKTPAPIRQLKPGTPTALVQIIDKAIQKDRRSRWQSAAEMRDALARLRGAQNRKGRRRALAAAISGFFFLVIAAALRWEQAPATARISDLKQRQLTTSDTENPVWGGAISPDGKHLAYSDSAGIHLKDLASGRVEDMSEPTFLRDRHVDWTVYWFPDNNRLLANASVAGELDSIWIASRLDRKLRKLRENGSAWGVAPDGRSIAFTQHHGRYGPRELWLMDSSTETVRKLCEADANSGFEQVRFRPMAGGSPM
jgi:serine/threonine protein kinase